MVWAGPAVAAERVALVVGNAHYSDSRAQLANPVNDARDLAELLVGLGYRVILRENAGRDAMNEAIREFTGLLDGSKVALFFYSGHAMQFQNSNYLLPVDVLLKTPREIVLDGVELAKVISLMQTAIATSIVILDASRESPFRGAFHVGPGLADSRIDPRDTLIVYSAGPNRIAYDGAGRNSIFTKHLLRHIATPDEDAVTMFRRVQRAVEQETLQFGPPQVPFVLSSLREFSFHPGGGGEATARAWTREAPAAGTAAINMTLPVPIAPELQVAVTQALPEVAPPVPDVPLVQGAAAAPEAGPGVTSSLAARRIDPPAQAVAAPAPDGVPPQPAEAGLAADLLPPSPEVPWKSGSAVEMEIRFADGSVFRGMVRNGRPNGVGELVLKDRYRYRGDFRDGLRQGTGESVWANGDVYIGEFFAELPHGSGRYSYANGEEYDGEFRGGKRHGHGRLTRPSGDSYQGAFVDDVEHGIGRLLFASGDVYDGEVRHGVIEGKGRFAFANGDIYEGEVSAGRPNGTGTLVFASGDRYDGQMRDGKPDGGGVYTTAAGDVYAGEVRVGQLTGKGSYRFRSGGRYIGEMRDGRPYGRGVFQFPDGSRFDGIFAGSVGRAEGQLIRPDGSSVPAEIIDGQTRLAGE